MSRDVSLESWRVLIMVDQISTQFKVFNPSYNLVGPSMECSSATLSNFTNSDLRVKREVTLESSYPNY